MSGNQILIKRYPNRRLYNTNSSEYINLSGVSTLVKDGKNIKIIDKVTGEDLTKQYLLQIISDIENKDGNILSENMLIEIIKTYNNATQKVMPEMVEKTFEFYYQQQNEFFKHFDTKHAKPFFNDTNSETIKNLQSKQAEFMQNLLYPWDQYKNVYKPKDENETLSKKEEIEILKKQMSELKEEFNKRK